MSDSENNRELPLKAKKRKYYGVIVRSIALNIMTKSGFAETHTYCTVWFSDFHIGLGAIADIAEHRKC